MADNQSFLQGPSLPSAHPGPYGQYIQTIWENLEKVSLSKPTLKLRPKPSTSSLPLAGNKGLDASVNSQVESACDSSRSPPPSARLRMKKKKITPITLFRQQPQSQPTPVLTLVFSVDLKVSQTLYIVITNSASCTHRILYDLGSLRGKV